MNDYDDEFYFQLPMFGDEDFELHDESRDTFELFEDEMDRLGNIHHLGILHHFESILKYYRDDHFKTMLLLIKKMREFENNKDGDEKECSFGMNSGPSLKNNVSFSSKEEFLKTWALLQSIGHLQTTFTSEHGLLRYLYRNKEKKEEFYDSIKTRINNSKLYSGYPDIRDNIFSSINSIIEKENVMRVYKIFTVLKISKIVENSNLPEEADENELSIGKLRELTRIILSRDQYVNTIEKSSQRKNLEGTIDYYLTIRNLAFTLLDENISQRFFNVNSFSIVENIDNFIEGNAHKTLLKDVNRFYTNTIYQNPESAYYRYRASREIENKVLSKYVTIEDLIDSILENNIDDEIREIIESETKVIKKEEKERLKKILMIISE